MKLLKKTEASLEKLGKNGELAVLVEELKEENEKLKADIEANSGNNASSEELEAAIKEKEELKSKLEITTKEKDEFKQAKTEAEKESEELKEEIGRLKRETKRNEGAEKDIMDLKFKIEELQKEVDTLNQDKQDLGMFVNNTLKCSGHSYLEAYSSYRD